MALQPVPLPGARVAFDPQWLPGPESDALFATLLTAVPWSVHRIRLFGREVESPRLSCWIGDPGAAYAYSGSRFQPHPWPAALQALRARLDAACGATFNSVLANLYRDGRDAMGWHRDDEPELGPQPVIASLSLGAPRRFLFKPVHAPSAEAKTRGGVQARPGPVAIELGHGSLLCMAGKTQALYRHALPRTARPVPPRINLTFRRVVAARD
ncbi:MAG TPA: alpha-ketoglutarate-dependent dioxygenase AlkB [Luteimonas sp.]|nr:alpha-ketoglutarate-dependent dioxygenase AlkB [Luteimonas sp.]